jgi:hypothetical protein
LEERHRTGRNFVSMNEREVTEICQRYGWEIVGPAGTLHVECVGSTRREVEDASVSVWAAVVDFDDDRAAIAEVRFSAGSGTCVSIRRTAFAS